MKRIRNGYRKHLYFWRSCPIDFFFIVSSRRQFFAYYFNFVQLWEKNVRISYLFLGCCTSVCNVVLFLFRFQCNIYGKSFQYRNNTYRYRKSHVLHQSAPTVVSYLCVCDYCDIPESNRKVFIRYINWLPATTINFSSVIWC